MWDQGSKGWDQGSEGWDLGSHPRNLRSHAMGLGLAFFFFLEMRDPAVPFMGFKQGPKFVTLLESRIRNLGS